MTNSDYNWARCLPTWGNVLAHHGHGACPCWADLVSDTCPFTEFSQRMQFQPSDNCKRIRDAALYTFVYHYTFAAKSKSLII